MTNEHVMPTPRRGRGAPFGNKNASKGREISEAIWKALCANDWKELRRGAQAVAKAFGDGEPWAVQTVLDRREGRPQMQLPEQDGHLVISWIAATPQVDVSRGTLDTIEHTAVQHKVADSDT